MLDNAYDKKSTPADKTPLNGDNADNNNNRNASAPQPADETPRFVPPQGGVDILKLLTELEDLVDNTRKGPMGVMLGFNEDKFHMTVMKIRANLPEEMKRASKLAKESERIVDESRQSAQRILDEARQKALQEIERGKADADHLREDAKHELNRAREAANVEVTRLHEAATADAARIVEKARAEAAQLLDDHEIIRLAQADAQDIQVCAQQAADAMRHGAEDYARDMLANLEGVLGKAMVQVQRGREMLEESR